MIDLIPPDASSADTPEKARTRRLWRVRMVGLVAASYVVDLLLLELFVYAGTIPQAAALGYAGAGLATCMLFASLFWSGVTERLRDPQMVMVQMLVACVIGLTYLCLYPRLAFFFLNVLFIVFGFGVLRLSLIEIVASWVIIGTASAFALQSVDQTLGLPDSSRLERTLVWFTFMVVLGRCILLGLYGMSLRVKLARRNAQLAESNQRIVDLVNVDDLTGALNRRAIMGALDSQLQLRRQAMAPLSVLLLDLDHFKDINDRFGHLMGDCVLREFSRIAAGAIRAPDQFGRYGGEEFIVALVAPESEAAAAVAERIRHAVHGHDWDGLCSGMAVTVSAGVASYRPGDDLNRLLKRADDALYRSKRAGRNCVTVDDRDATAVAGA